MVPAQQLLLQFIHFKCLVMKVYLVTSCCCALVGIEKCQAIIVFPGQQAAFVKEYAGRILLAGCSISALPPVSIHVYNKGS